MHRRSHMSSLKKLLCRHTCIILRLWGIVNLYCYAYCHGLCLSVTGGRGARTRESSRPRSNSRPELVPGPGAPPQALWRIWRPGLGHCTVPRRCCVYPGWSATPGQTLGHVHFSTYHLIHHPCFVLVLMNHDSVLSPLPPGAQPLQLYQGGRGLCVSWTCEALFQTDPGVQTSVNHPHEPRRQATG